MKPNLNYLEQFRLSNSLLCPDKATLNYWKGLRIPVFLFAVVVGRDDCIDCYYKRYSGILAKDSTSSDKEEYYGDFFKVNKGRTFHAYIKLDSGDVLGFARDLYIDHIRLSYSSGTISAIRPEDLGLVQWPHDAVFADMLREYQEPIIRTYIRTGKALKELGILSDLLDAGQVDCIEV